MRSHTDNIEKVLQRSFPSASEQQVESARDRIYERLRSDRTENFPVETFLVDVAPLRRTRQFVWVTVALALAALSVAGIRNVVLNRNAAAFMDTSEGRARIAFGQIIRSERSGLVLSLKDGSQVEMRSKSELAMEAAADGTRIRLYSGSIIVTAAEQRTGHLYVQTRDLTASVVGTVFVVKAEESGSRVAVIQGEVRVKQGAKDRNLKPGEEVATNPLVETHGASREVSWSRDAERHLALLQQAVTPGAVPQKASKFEVASVRTEARSGPAIPAGITPQCMGVDGLLKLRNPTGATLIDVDPNYQPAPPVAARGRCVAKANLIDIIALAYGVDFYLASNMGGPEWAQRSFDSLVFEVNAKADNPEKASKTELQQMLQAMLADRFKLKLSWENREVEGFVVYVEKGGHRLVGAASEEPLKQVERRNGETLQRVITGKASLKDFVDFIGLRPPLMSRMGSSDAILDRTDLKGIYIFNFRYTVPAVPLGDGSGRRGGGAPAAFGVTTPALANFRDALQEQLGLRLEFAKIPIDIPVIEQVEKPAEN